MNNVTKKSLGFTGIMWLVFLLYTVLISAVDIKSYMAMPVNFKEDITSLGSIQSTIGFGSINLAIHNLLGTSKFFYVITSLLGTLAILIALFYMALGLLQLIKFKSFAKVERRIYALGITYVLTGAIYILFEVVKVNYRPVILKAAEGLEASYPSSHVMLTLVILTCTMLDLRSRIKDKAKYKIVKIIIVVLLVLAILGRLLSGVHWFTDVLGSVILSIAIVNTYQTIKRILRTR